MNEDRLAYDITNRDDFGITVILITDKEDPCRMYTIHIDTIHEKDFLKNKVLGRWYRKNINEKPKLI